MAALLIAATMATHGSSDAVTDSALRMTNVSVGTAAELSAALAAATPGQTIELAPGHYEGNFFATREGTADQPITLTGPRTAVLSSSGGACDPGGGDPKFCGYGLHLHGADHWKFPGFAVSDAAKGTVLDGSSHVLIDRVEVSNVDPSNRNQVIGNKLGPDGVGSLLDGYQVHQAVAGWGCQNAFTGNRSDLGGADGYAINVTDQKKCDRPDVVYASNTVRNGGSGLTNIPVS